MCFLNRRVFLVTAALDGSAKIKNDLFSRKILLTLGLCSGQRPSGIKPTPRRKFIGKNYSNADLTLC